MVWRRPAVRVRPWAPNSIRPFPCIFCAGFSLPRCGKEMVLRRAFVSQLGVAGIADWHHVHRSGGDRWRRSVGPKSRPAGGRTGQDRETAGLTESTVVSVCGFDSRLPLQCPTPVNAAGVWRRTGHLYSADDVPLGRKRRRFSPPLVNRSSDCSWLRQMVENRSGRV